MHLATFSKAIINNLYFKSQLWYPETCRHVSVTQVDLWEMIRLVSFRSHFTHTLSKCELASTMRYSFSTHCRAHQGHLEHCDFRQGHQWNKAYRGWSVTHKFWKQDRFHYLSIFQQLHCSEFKSPWVVCFWVCNFILRHLLLMWAESFRKDVVSYIISVKTSTMPYKISLPGQEIQTNI